MARLLNIVFLGTCFIAAFDTPAMPDERSRELDRAITAYEEAREQAREYLLRKYDLAVKRLSAKTFGLTAEDRLKLIDVVKAENKRFEQGGFIPWSLPMRSYLAAYQRNMAGAESQLRRAYDQALAQALRAQDENTVNELRADLETVLQPKVVATWLHRAGRGPHRITLYSNGKINAVDSKHTWAFRNGILTLVWVNVRAPGGAWREVCTVSPDGSSYSGKNQHRHRVGGDYVIPE